MSADPSRSLAAGPDARLERLLRLQEVDVAIDRLRARLALLEAQGEVREARTRAADAEGRFGRLGLSVEEVARDQRRLESDLDSIERKIQAERARLYDGTVANPKELQSIEREVENLRGRASRMEDQLIEVMERREQLEAERGSVQAELAEARARLGQIEGVSAAELVEVERGLAQRGSERAGIAESVDEELLGTYEELRRQKKGVGVAALTEGVCQGCHQQLSPVYLAELKRTDPLRRRCEHCRRILVLA